MTEKLAKYGQGFIKPTVLTIFKIARLAIMLPSKAATKVALPKKLSVSCFPSLIARIKVTT